MRRVAHTALTFAILIAILTALAYVYASSPSCSDADDPAYCSELQHAPRTGQ